MIVGQRISSQSMVQMYGQHLKAIGCHVLRDEVLKVVTDDAKPAETSLDRDLPAASGAEVHLVVAIAQNATRAREESWRSSVIHQRKAWVSSRTFTRRLFGSPPVAQRRNWHLL